MFSDPVADPATCLAAVFWDLLFNFLWEQNLFIHLWTKKVHISKFRNIKIMTQAFQSHMMISRVRWLTSDTQQMHKKSQFDEILTLCGDCSQLNQPLSVTSTCPQLQIQSHI